MKDNNPPSKLFKQLLTIKNKYNKRLNKLKTLEKVALIVEKDPAKYQIVLTTEQLRLGATVMAKELFNAMNTYYRVTKTQERQEEEEDNNDEEEKVILVFSKYCLL